MARRSRAREIALQVLFQEDLNPQSGAAPGDQLLKQRLRSPEVLEFGRALVAGVRRHRAEIDCAIAQVAANWDLDRMAATDRNLLRLAAYEILFGDTPGRVAINEAVELAKRYGTAHSAQFVNGILDKLMHDSTSAEPHPPTV